MLMERKAAKLARGARVVAGLAAVLLVLGVLGALPMPPKAIEGVGYLLLVALPACFETSWLCLLNAPRRGAALLALSLAIMLAGQFQRRAEWFPLTRWAMYTKQEGGDTVAALFFYAVHADGTRASVRWSDYVPRMNGVHLGILQRQLCCRQDSAGQTQCRRLLMLLGALHNARFPDHPATRLEAWRLVFPLGQAPDDAGCVRTQLHEVELALYRR
jgi:hypothetical protein